LHRQGLADEVCNDTEEDGRYCLRRCEKDDDCDVEERCKPAGPGNGKTCHPDPLE
jgi:hypothetical protein